MTAGPDPGAAAESDAGRQEAEHRRARAADERKRADAAWDRPLDLVDVVMLLLAIFSVGLLIFVRFFDRENAGATWVVAVDTTICGIFAVEFAWRWRKTGWQRRYPLTHWYEVIGMIPVTEPALRGFRLLRVVVVLVRVARAGYRVFGERITNRLIERLTDPLVEAVKRPIVLLVLDEVVQVVETGKIPLGVAAALRENSAELEQLVVEKLNADPMAGRLALVPFSERITRAMIETTLRVTLEVLADPRVDEFVTDVVRRNQERIRATVLAHLEGERA
ncbi:ion transporter [Thermocrispum sp.]|uniref:ion transporter n=1 Tax=Thermocrispum sp. TaxID=2060768 RepID=UPI00257C7DF2|nr:ion transporter [Thermocrispum sp.]